jgi:hypothetical protein
MRFAPEPVKLQFDNVFDNVCRVRIKYPPGEPPFSLLKNTVNIDICAGIAPFRRTSDAAPGDIDENGSLPYKPRQLSAMTRFDRGGSFWPETARFGPVASSDLSHS